MMLSKMWGSVAVAAVAALALSACANGGEEETVTEVPVTQAPVEQPDASDDQTTDDAAAEDDATEADSGEGRPTVAEVEDGLNSFFGSSGGDAPAGLVSCVAQGLVDGDISDGSLRTIADGGVPTNSDDAQAFSDALTNPECLTAATS